MLICHAITLIFLTKFILPAHSTNECESLRICQQCIREPTCGWYLKYRSTNGSGCFKSDKLTEYEKTQDGYSYPPKASFYIENADENNEVTPSKVALTIRVNEPFTFPVTFRPQRNWKQQGIQLKYTTKYPENKINFYTNCSGQYDQIQETSRCDNIKFGDSVVFFVQVEKKSCAKRQPEQIRTIKMNVFPSSAIFRLHLYAYCFCSCEIATIRDRPLPQVVPDCRNRGSFICGVCYCEDGFAGENCEINTSNIVS